MKLCEGWTGGNNSPSSILWKSRPCCVMTSITYGYALGKDLFRALLESLGCECQFRLKRLVEFWQSPVACTH